MNSRLLVIVAALALGSCASHTWSPARPSPSPAAATEPSRRHENLNAVAWVQTAVEYRASTEQAYRLATLQLDAALKDPSWTAAIEQNADASKLPPAVVLDIDETVLDTSAFQARGVRDNSTYSEEAWQRWVAEAGASAVPGAKDFTQYAAQKGVAVFYISNRMAVIEAPTRTNLQALGFPLDARVDTVLSRGERPEWAASGKGPRREFVAANYRILLLVGDDLGDFVVNASGTVEERLARAAGNDHWWGRRWIMIPNPTYGSWERALIGSSQDPLAAKRAALRY
ncbi:MAG: 5'-nucleotidase, lipoprotein e(P4) family [Vicinamibacterales bacterium]